MGQRPVTHALALATAIAALPLARAAADEPEALPPDPPPPESLPAPPPLPPHPLPEELGRPPSPLRHALHLGVSFGLEVARDGGGAYAVGGGVHLGWELYWPSIAVELAVEAQAHGDKTTDPDHWFTEVHPALLLKRPFRGGAWEAFVSYGFSPGGWHDGWLPHEDGVHVGAIGLEDRTRRAFSRLYVRAYAPEGTSLADVTIVVCATVGLFHLF